MTLNNSKLQLDISSCIIALASDTNLDATTQKYLLRRYNAEGISFLTKVLPKFVGWVERSVDNGYLDMTQFTYFDRKNSSPRYFSGLLSQIFDTHGYLKEIPCLESLKYIRQWGHAFYKLALPFTDEQLQEAADAYLSHEEKLRTTCVDEKFIDSLRKRIESVYTFPTIHNILDSHRPRFGPGSYSTTFEHESSSGSKLRLFKYWMAKTLEDATCTFTEADRGISGYFKPYPGCEPGLLRIGQDTADVSEVLFVPKDSRGPRVISREPLKRLQLQMSFFDAMVPFMEKVSHGRINFRDQQVNRDLARIGSETGEWATIDLKNASDSILGHVVQKLFRNIPGVNYFVKKRSRTSVLPDGKFITLNKLSGMGSGLTFPMLAFLCHTSISHKIATTLHLEYGYVAKFIYVYGDDIIMPTQWIPYAYNALASIGLNVNTNKSFVGTPLESGTCFRESCGGDYFGGFDVSPSRMKFTNSSITHSQGQLFFEKEDQGIVEMCDAAENSLNKGFPALAELLYSTVEKVTGTLPLKGATSSWIGRFDPSFVTQYDETGTVRRETRMVTVPLREENPNACQHAYLSLALRPTPSFKTPEFGNKVNLEDPSTRWWEGITDSASTDTLVVPREYKIRRRTTNLFS